MKIWLRHNRWRLLAVAVLIPATLVATSYGEWKGYESRTFSSPRLAAAGDSVNYANSTFTVVESGLITGGSTNGDELSLDEAIDVVVAVVSVTPTPTGTQPVSCSLSIAGSSPRVPATRRWDANVSLPPGFPRIDGTVSYCGSTDGEPYRLQIAATVPHGAVDSSRSIIIEIDGQQPNYLELALPAGAD